ncbi:fibronectin type III domain-containing protein, partial [Patescibacteria group bacterium]|nr:fibronectin type III domain-containing protein [Patescibacteria group bacterium]
MKRLILVAILAALCTACGSKMVGGPTAPTSVANTFTGSATFPSLTTQLASVVKAEVACSGNIPSSLVSRVDDSTVTLTWNPPAAACGATSYFIEAGSASGLANLANFPSGVVPTYTARDVGNGTYFVRVRAGQGPPSNEVVVVVGVFVGLNGTWKGQWLYQGSLDGVIRPTQLTLAMSQNGRVLSGSWSKHGGAFIDMAGQISGTVDGSNVAITLGQT